MQVPNKKVFRILACCELMQTDHEYFVKCKGKKERRFVKGDRLRFLTLTVPDSYLPLRLVADRFRALSNSRWWRKLMRFHSYICVYEPHPGGHGWHIHILTNTFIPWRELDLMARAYMFGHTDIEAANTECAFYVAKYVTKAHVIRKLQDSKHVRIVNVSRDLLPLYDIQVASASVDFIRSHWEFLEGFSIYERLVFLYYEWVYNFCGKRLYQNLRLDEMVESLNKKSGLVGWAERAKNKGWSGKV